MSAARQSVPEPILKWARLLWWGVALVGGGVLLAEQVWRPDNAPFWHSWVFQFGEAYFWWLWLPTVLALRRWLEADRPWWVWLVAHAVAGTAAVLLAESLHVVLQLCANQLPGAFFPEVWGDVVNARSLLQRAWTYAVLVVPLYAFGYYLNWRAERRESEELKLAHALVENRLVRANLDALKMQLHPHFLFNALNSIAALVRCGQSEQAEEAVAKLATLLRRALDHRQDQLVPLAVEVDFLELYFEIERIRFQDRLLVEIVVPRSCEAALVPSLLVQPLVENAMKHGFARAPDARRLRLEARRDEGRLELSLYNDGPALPADFAGVGQGIGLRNIRARLTMLYGDRAGLELSNAPGGVVARVHLPFQLSSP